MKNLTTSDHNVFDLSDAEMDTKLQKGFEDIAAGRTKSAEDVFPDIRSELKEQEGIQYGSDCVENEFFDEIMMGLDEAIEYAQGHIGARVTKMDLLPLVSRRKALEMSRAVLAVEGSKVSPETKSNLEAWAEGTASFADGYLATLKRYNLKKR